MTVPLRRSTRSAFRTDLLQTAENGKLKGLVADLSLGRAHATRFGGTGRKPPFEVSKRRDARLLPI